MKRRGEGDGWREERGEETDEWRGDAWPKRLAGQLIPSKGSIQGHRYLP